MRNKIKKLKKVEKLILTKIPFVSDYIFNGTSGSIKMLLDSNIHIYIELRDNLMYYVALSKVDKNDFSDDFFKNYKLISHHVFERREILKYITDTINKDDDHIFLLREDKLKRILK